MTQLAFVFPGQGSQQLGMLADVANQYPLIRHTFGEASDALNLDLWQLCQENESALNQTENTQPVLLTAGVALWRVWQAFGGAQPQYLAGHSLGEYTALVAWCYFLGRWCAFGGVAWPFNAASCACWSWGDGGYFGFR